MVMWGGYVWVLYRVGEADTRQSGSFRACVIRSNSFIFLNITVFPKPETARSALYAARPPNKARQKVAPTTDSITLPPVLRK